jgi:hypothetical protein
LTSKLPSITIIHAITITFGVIMVQQFQHLVHFSSMFFLLKANLVRGFPS